MNPLPNPLRDAREKIGKRLTQVAKEIGINKSTVSRIENKKADLHEDLHEKFALAYGLTIEEIKKIASQGPSVRKSPSREVFPLLTVIVNSKLTTISLNELLFLLHAQDKLGVEINPDLAEQLVIANRKSNST